MGSLYYTDMADLFRGAGITVVESDGWETRARSSGGFANPPLGCQWHHTASKTNPENDIAWQTEGSDDAPIGNCTIMRDGSIWMVAAGAANTAGQGGPLTLSRGTVPEDSGNSTTWAFEVANNGVGEPWPQVQIDAYFTASNVANERFGNKPTDVFTHHVWAPDRKIDPATAAAVQGPWKPRSINNSGTWNLDDIRDECARRAGAAPGPSPTPPPDEEDDHMLGLVRLDSNPNAIYVTDGISARLVRSDEVDELSSNLKYNTGFRYYDLTSAERVQIRDINKIPKRTDDQIQLWGLEIAESKSQPG